jgi:hypothetical protein
MTRRSRRMVSWHGSAFPGACRPEHSPAQQTCCYTFANRVWESFRALCRCCNPLISQPADGSLVSGEQDIADPRGHVGLYAAFSALTQHSSRRWTSRSVDRWFLERESRVPPNKMWRCRLAGLARMVMLFIRCSVMKRLFIVTCFLTWPWNSGGLMWLYRCLEARQGLCETRIHKNSFERVRFVPAAPDSLTATAVSGSEIDLAWLHNSSDETGLEIERSPDGTTFSLLASDGANTTSDPGTGLSATTTYWYRIWSERNPVSANVSQDWRAVGG